MKLVNVLRGQATRLFAVAAPGGGNLYGQDIVKAFEARYGFLEGPKTVAEYDLQKGMTFLHGHFGHKFVIDQLKIFYNGINVDSKVSTENLDDFLDDAIRWAGDQGVIASRDENIKRGYYSEIDVQSDLEIGRAFPQFKSLGSHITTLARSYGFNAAEYEFTTLALNGDSLSLPTPKPIAFVFDRKAGEPISSGRYYSSASLKTMDHLSVVTELETILMAMTNAS